MKTSISRVDWYEAKFELAYFLHKIFNWSVQRLNNFDIVFHGVNISSVKHSELWSSYKLNGKSVIEDAKRWQPLAYN